MFHELTMIYWLKKGDNSFKYVLYTSMFNYFDNTATLQCWDFMHVSQQVHSSKTCVISYQTGLVTLSHSGVITCRVYIIQEVRPDPPPLFFKPSPNLTIILLSQMKTSLGKEISKSLKIGYHFIIISTHQIIIYHYDSNCDFYCFEFSIMMIIL